MALPSPESWSLDRPNSPRQPSTPKLVHSTRFLSFSFPAELFFRVVPDQPSCPELLPRIPVASTLVQVYEVCARPESVQTKQARLRPKDLSKPDHARYREENNSFIFLGAGYGFSSSLCIILVISKKTCRKTAKHNLSNVPGKNIL